jgi:methylphosphotriester-DNA--protein-cysteine methyltransferase
MGPAETEGIDWIRADQAGTDHADWLVKGNAGSGIFHTPESPSYERTIAEVWFPNAEAAERSGYRAPRSAHHAGSSAAAGAKNAAIEATDAAKADDEA